MPESSLGADAEGHALRTTFFRLLSETEKGIALKKAVERVNRGEQAHDDVFQVETEDFRKVPNSPLAYWVDDFIRELFQMLPPFESDGRTVKQGLATADDFRFVRAWWEVPPERKLDAGKGPEWRANLDDFRNWCRERTCRGRYWVPFAKGGEYSPFYSDIHLVVNWKDEGAIVRNLYDERRKKLLSRPQNIDYYFRPGLTWPLRASRYDPWPLPAASIFSVRGYSIFVPTNQLGAAFDLFNSDAWDFFHKMFVGRYGHPEFLVGTASILPFPSKSLVAGECLALARTVSRLLSSNENVSSFVGIFGETDQTQVDPDGFNQVKLKVNNAAAYAFELPSQTRSRINRIERERLGKTGDVENKAFGALIVTKTQERSRIQLSYLAGIAFGRWDIRMALNESLVPKLADPFDPLPVCPPAILIGPDGLPAKSAGIVSAEWLRARPNAITLPPSGSVDKSTISDDDYLIQIPWDGILVDDSNHRSDLATRVRAVMQILWKDEAFSKEQEICVELNVSALEEYLHKPSGFFADHLARYSKSKRKAPIYWPLSTKSGSYTLWIYYPTLSDETLYTCVKHYVDPKLEDSRRQLADVTAKRQAGVTTDLKRRYDELSSLVEELEELKAELLRVAALPYRPDLDDGVMICASPLHRLFRLGKWKKDLEACWKKLEEGRYDWAHLAYGIWPERVTEKCQTDRSLAIAHGLEEICTVPRRDRSNEPMVEDEIDPDEDDEE